MMTYLSPFTRFRLSPYRLLLALLLCSGMVRIILAMSNPVWLDENYSMVFATQYGLGDMVMHLPDIHPPLYYAILRVAILIGIRETGFLRVLFTVLPHMVGLLLLTVFVESKRRFDYKRVIVWTLVFLFNPFFIHLSWQLRMYGLVFLAAAICSVGYFSAVQTRRFEGLFVTLLGIVFGVSVSASFYLLAAGIVAGLAAANLIAGHRRYTIVLILFLSVQFLVFVLGHPKFQLDDGLSWIPPFRFELFPSVLSTAFGSYWDIALPRTMPFPYSVVSLTGFISLGILAYGFRERLGKQINVWLVPLVFFGTAIALSFLTPLVSELPGLRRIIPPVSVFLPRFLLPGIVLLLTGAFLYLDFPKRSARPIRIALVVFVLAYSLGWIGAFRELVIGSSNRVNRYKLLLGYPPSTTSERLILFPSWRNYTHFQLQSPESITLSHKLALDSDRVINGFLSQQPGTCYPSFGQPARIIQMRVTVDSDNTNAMLLLQYLERCCSPVDTTAYRFQGGEHTEWICN